MTIAGSDSGGGAGIQADLKTFSALGVHGACVIASVTSQNTTGVKAVFDIPVAEIGNQIDAVCSDLDIVFAKTGMLSSPEIVRFVAEKAAEYNLSLVVDPVMAAEAGGELLRKDAVSMMADALLPVSYAVTPNIFEAEILSGMKINTEDDAKKAAVKIAETGVRYVIITGGHLNATDIVYDSVFQKFTLLPGLFVKGGTHGTGCTFSSALTACLARGFEFDQACQAAKSFVVNAILYSENIGNGVAPVNPGGCVVHRYERAAVIENILSAWALLKTNPVFPTFIPKDGTNIAMTLPDIFRKSVRPDFYSSEILPHLQVSAAGNSNNAAADGFGSPDAVTAAFSKGIHKIKDPSGTKVSAENLGYPLFGSGAYSEKAIQSVQEFDITIRACIHLKYTEETIQFCQKAGLAVQSFNRANGPSDFDEMKDRGTLIAIQNNSNDGSNRHSSRLVPDIIYETGDLSKEGIIRVFGTDAVDAALKVLRICDESN